MQPPIKGLRSFSDALRVYAPDQEMNYLAAVRAEHQKSVKALCMIAITVMLIYLIANPILFPDIDAKRFSIPAVLMILTALSYVFISRINFYKHNAFIDIPFFLMIFICQLLVNISYFDISFERCSSPSTIVAYNAAVLLPFIAIGIVGSVRSFLCMVSIITAITIYFISNLGLPYEAQIWNMMPYFTALILCIIANIIIDTRSRNVYILSLQLHEQTRITEELLYNVLPKTVAERLRSGQVVADSFSEVSVIFIDIIGFSGMSKTLSANHLVEILNGFFSNVDKIAISHEVDKVKTIGDAYLAIAGSITPVANPAIAAIDFSRSVLSSLDKLSQEFGFPVNIRIGIHTGSVVGGVIGTARHSYDYWGDTMNIASRLQAAAGCNGISVSETTYYRAKGQIDFCEPRTLTLKGIGETQVYDVVLKVPSASAESANT